MGAGLWCASCEFGVRRVCRVRRGALAAHCTRTPHPYLTPNATHHCDCRHLDTRAMEPTSDTMAPHLISTAPTFLKFDKVITLRKLLGWDQRNICCAFWSKHCLHLPTCYGSLRAMNRLAASQATKPHSSGAECGQRDEGRT